MLSPSPSRFDRVHLVSAAMAAVVAAIVMTAVPVAADDPEPGPSGDGSAYTGGSGPSSTPGSSTDTDGSSGAPGPPVDYDFTFMPDGEGVGAEPGYENDGCWGVEVVPEGQGTSYAEAAAAADAQGSNGVLWGNCKPEEIDIAAVVQAGWRSIVRPPPPTPLQVAPGRMYPGLTAYLEIGGENPTNLPLASPFGNLTIRATARYVVTWGDGSETSTTNQGQPYPGGPDEVTHVYDKDGNITITVRAYWSGTWQFFGQSGTLPELPVPTTASLDLPVYERQPVTN